MMTTPHVAVLFGFGINCDHETAAVFDLVGGKSERVHVNHFISGKRSLDAVSYTHLTLPTKRIV